MSDTQTFESFVENERKRLNKLREDTLAKRAELDDQIANIDRELEAISAYELAKQGKLPTASRAPRSTGKRRTGIRAEVLAHIKNAGKINRAGLLEKMGVKGDKSGEQSVSNALSALKRNGDVKVKDGMYAVA